jgi:hypothetical protein
MNLDDFDDEVGNVDNHVSQIAPQYTKAQTQSKNIFAKQSSKPGASQ